MAIGQYHPPAWGMTHNHEDAFGNEALRIAQNKNDNLQADNAMLLEENQRLTAAVGLPDGFVIAIQDEPQPPRQPRDRSRAYDLVYVAAAVLLGVIGVLA